MKNIVKYIIPFIPVLGILIIIISLFTDSSLVYIEHKNSKYSKFVLSNGLVFITSSIVQSVAIATMILY